MSIPAPAKIRARITCRSLVAVAVGGFCGAALRVGLGLWFPEGAGFPATTLLINVTGTATLGALTSYWQVSHRGAGWLRAGIGTGFMGAFTTFSALVLFTLGAAPGVALLNLALSLVLCAAAAWAAMAWVERVLGPGNKGAQASGPGTDRTANPRPGGNR